MEISGSVLMTALPPKHKAAFLPTWRLHSWIVLFVLLFPASHTYNKHMKLCAFHAWLPNTFWLSDFHKVCVCVCVHLHQLCQFSDEKSAPSAVLSVRTEEEAHHTVGVPFYQLQPPAFLQVAFAKVVLLISNIFDFQCETHCLRRPPLHKKGSR